jgi:hypothetical protein
MVGCRNPNSAGCRQTRFRPKLAGIQPWSEASRIWPKWWGYGRIWPGSRRIRSLIRPNLARMAGIRSDLTGFGGVRQESGQTCSPKFGNGDRTLPDSGDSYIFTFRNFFVRAKRRKIFSKKSFFLKIISSKIFFISRNKHSISFVVGSFLLKRFWWQPFHFSCVVI